MKKIVLAMMIALSAFTVSARSAASIINAMSDALTKAKTISADFRITDPNVGVYDGSIDVSSNKFAVKTSQGTVVYDGLTQWSVDPGVKEVSIYEPTQEEVMQINPFALLRACKTQFKSKLLSDNGNTARVELTPKEKGSSIKKIAVTVDTSKNEPRILTMTLDDGASIRIDITALRLGVNLAPDKFVINTKDYPGYDVIDLR